MICKYCGQRIKWLAFEFSPSNWFHTATENTLCYPVVTHATPIEGLPDES